MGNGLKGPGAPSTVFICYRRSDTGGICGRLYDRLSDIYGHDEIFRDVEDIPGMAKWRVYAERALATTKVMIAMIGSQWFDVIGESGKRRLTEVDDQVRGEIEIALRLEVPILPVLVDGTKMPSSSRLPESIRELNSFNALPLDSHSFDHHVERIIKTLEQATGIDSDEDKSEPKPQYLEQLMPGTWQLRIQYPNGFIGQGTAQFYPTKQFIVQGVGAQTFEIQGMWQLSGPGALMLSGQQTSNFQVFPYSAIIQINQSGPNQLESSASTGERISWTRMS
jgi:hypothetical protein